MMKLENNLYDIIYENHKEGIYKLRLNPDCLIYKCHFPDKPVTPGVCIIQMVSELTSKTLGKEINLKAIPNAKFLKAIEPIQNQEIEIIIDLKEVSENNNEIKINALVKNGNEVFSKITSSYTIS